MESSTSYNNNGKKIAKTFFLKTCLLLLLNLIPQEICAQVNTSYVDQWGVTQMKFVKFDFLWTVTNFSLHSEKYGEYFTSPPFSSSENNRYNWSLILYPRGSNSSEYLSVFLNYTAGDTPLLKADYKISILNSSYHAIKIFSDSQIFKINGSAYGSKSIIGRDFVLKPINNVLRNDALTIYIEIIVSTGLSNIHGDCNLISQERKNQQFSDHLAMFLDSRKFSDVTLARRAERYPAHKVILASRSSFFAQIFANITPGVVELIELQEIEPYLIPEFLRFMYTGRIKKLDENAQTLLEVAHYYGVNDLKILTEENICHRIDFDNSLEILLLADKFDANNLKLKAIHFIAAHISKYLHTASFQDLEQRYPELVVEIFNSIVNNVI